MTIEERAREAYRHYVLDENNQPSCAYIPAYIQGATEQRAIDDEYWTNRLNAYAEDARKSQEALISKACECLLHSLPTPAWYGSTEEFVDEFRKEMEE